MRHDDDVDYYQQRAEQEIELAQRADDQRAVQAHYQLASAYLDRIYPEDQEPPRSSH
ncbi:MAG TPA: hypothetical protein VGD19_04460 [Allosphingosinicella sp.]